MYKIILKFIWNQKRPRIDKAIMRKKNKTGGIILPDFTILQGYSNQNSMMMWCDVKVAQSCPTLCNPIVYTVHGILQARTLDWIAFPFSRASSQPRDWTQVSPIAGRFLTSWATREAQNSMILAQNRHMNQWNRLESPEINPHAYNQSIFDKGSKNMQSLQQVVLGKLAAACKSMKLENTLMPHTKINLKWLKTLNIRHDTGTSLAIQWLRLCASKAGSTGSNP